MRLPSALSAAAQRSSALIGHILMAEDSAVKPEIKTRAFANQQCGSWYVDEKARTLSAFAPLERPKEGTASSNDILHVASLSFLSVGRNRSPMIIESPHALHQKACEEA